MSGLTLVSHPLCPFVQRAAILLLEKKVPFERIDIDLAAKPAWFLALSPLGKVPLLRVRADDDRETVLFESMAICEYLEESQPGPRLHPADALERATHRGWIEFGSATLADAWAMLTTPDPAIAGIRQRALRDKLARLETALAPGGYFAGERFSMVDAVFAPVFRYFDALGETRLEEIAPDLFAALPAVAAWRRALAQRPSVAGAVGTDYRARLRAFLDSKK